MRGILTPCLSCGGSANGHRHAGRGWIHLDAYTGRRVGSAQTESVTPTKRVHCDACSCSGSVTSGPWRGERNRCERCFGSGEIELTLSQWQALREHANGNLPGALGLRSGDPIIASLQRDGHTFGPATRLWA